ncbi:Probable RNA-directed DNA polymerase from transposon BS [Eumeta japonica]|uniref:Probable RNA-directed DNA polymerase from transposon BS n=1 Tax=Eumeta variegata TaxID=151549 RepID=A0A4C1ZLF5_EUMVA|nr:Probable RNA-directed DNA polymerase from transposon BS [Eumeta japonica]
MNVCYPRRGSRARHHRASYPNTSPSQCTSQTRNILSRGVKRRGTKSEFNRETSLPRLRPPTRTAQIRLLNRNHSHSLLALLVAIFNACNKNCHFPETWKEAVIIGIPKPDKPHDLPTSYRPSSLLSGLGKLFDRVLKSRLSDHLLGNGLIINKQFGFRPNHSCPQQAFRVVEHISEGFKCKRKTVAVFSDVAKAFDKVWHAGLFYKLHQLQVPDHLVFIIYQYLTNRHFSFRDENSTSAKRLIRAGVPQGSALSPLLYSTCTNDISRPQTGGVFAAEVAGTYLSCITGACSRLFEKNVEYGISAFFLFFADDTVLYLAGSNFRQIIPRLQKAIDELTRWFQTWKIEVSPEKSAAIFFNYSRTKKKEVVPYNSPTFRINNSPIPWNHKHKYLGITLDKYLHFKDQIKRVRQNVQLYLLINALGINASVHATGDDVRAASLRPCRPKGPLPTSDSAKQLLHKSLWRTLVWTPPYYDLKRSSDRCALRAPGILLGDSARAKSPRDFLCRDAHLAASIWQSRADGIPCRTAATDEILKAPIYWGYGQETTNMLLWGFCRSMKVGHTPRTWVRGSFSVPLLPQGKTKKNKNSRRPVPAPIGDTLAFGKCVTTLRVCI